jgi:virulence-associated protein VagC
MRKPHSTPGGRKYRAKVFRNGRSQAIRLPKELRFDPSQKEVSVRREQGRLVVELLDEWPEDFWSLFGSVPDLDVPARHLLAGSRDRFHR